MATEIENELARYFAWIEEQTGLDLHRADQLDDVDSPGADRPIGDRALDGRVPRRWWLAAAVIVGVLALGLLAVAAVQDPDSVQTDTVPDTPAPSTSAMTTTPPSTTPVSAVGTTLPTTEVSVTTVIEPEPPATLATPSVTTSVPAVFTPTIKDELSVTMQVEEEGANGVINSAVFTPDGAKILSTLGGGVAVIDAATGEEATLSPAPTSRWQLSNDGQLFFDGQTVWDTTTGTAKLILDEAHPQWFGTATFSPDGERIAATVGVPPWENPRGIESVEIYDISSGALVTTLETSGLQVFSPDGRKFATTGLSGPDGGLHVQIWDVATGAQLLTLDGICDFGGFSPDGSKLLVFHDCGQRVGWTVQVLDAADGRVVSEVAGGYRGWFSPDGGKVVLWASEMGQLMSIWDPDDGTVITLPREANGYFLFEVGRASFNSDGSMIVTPLNDGSQTAVVWDTTTGERLATLSGHTEKVLSAAYSPHGATIVTTSGDHSIRLWDASTP